MASIRSFSSAVRRGLLAWGLCVLALPALAAPPTQAWGALSPGGSGDAEARFGSNLTPANRRALAVDSAGFSYVTGSRFNGSSLDYLTQKFGPAGNLVWSVTYNGPGNGNDQAVALVLAAGDVVVTGQATGLTGNLDYATLKYDGATGAPKWSGGAIVAGAALYSGPLGNRDDVATALAFDGAGDVVVTGWSIGDGTGPDYATLKYDGATGAPEWSGGAIVNGAARYNGPPGNGSDTAQALALNASGDVLVTGYSAGSGTGDDYATLKYDGATGAPEWSGGAIVDGAARFNGPGNGTDRAVALALNGFGDVLVTGQSTGIGTNSDYATLKYDGATGVPEWVGGATVNGAARFNGPVNGFDQALALALDPFGNVVVTGQSPGSGTGLDYATLKYDGTTGATAWTGGAIVAGAARYNGPPGNGDDASYALALDGAGDVLVTGFSAGSGTGVDYATLKYDGATGAPEWTGGAIVAGAARYNGAGNGNDQAFALALDGNGELRVAGTTLGVLNEDFGVLSYSGAGAQLWFANEGPASGSSEQFGSNLAPANKRALAVDAAGNSYVTGSRHNGSNFDYLTQKFDPAGNLLWSRTYNGPANSNDQAVALAVDAAGDVVVTGQSRGVFTSDDYATLKYDGDTGVPLWPDVGVAVVNGAARYDGPLGNGNDVAVALVLDAAGDVLVTGYSAGGVTGEDYATLKYDGATGVADWTARYSSPGIGDDQAVALAVDAAGDVVVTGVSSGAGLDYATVKYDGTTGAPEWSGGAIVAGAARFNGTAGGGDDQPYALALDAVGDVLVTGHSAGAGTGSDYATLKYDGVTGAPEWSGGAIVAGAARYNGPPGNTDDGAYALVVDAAGDVLVTGQSVGLGTDYATLKYDGATGTPKWSGGAIINGAARYNGPVNGHDRAYALALDAAGDVLVTGSSTGSGTGNDYLTLKYDGNSGAAAWVHRYNGPGNSHDQAYALAMAADASLRIAGTTTTAQGERFGVIKLFERETTSAVVVDDSPDPSAIGQTVSVTAQVSGSASAPTDGQVQIGADTGETCTDTTPSAVDVDTAAFSCDLVFNSAGSRLLTAQFSGSATHQDSASGGLESHRVPQPVTVSFGNLSHVYDGTAKAATATFSDLGAGTPVLTYTPVAAPIDAGDYTVTASLSAASTDYTLSGVVDATLVITKATAQVTLSNLTRVFNGSPRPVTVSTTPAGLGVNVSYDGNGAAPSAVGSYAVLATVNDLNYQGSASGTLTILAAAVSQFLIDSATPVNGIAGAPLATGDRPRVRVLDNDGNGVAGISIVFAVASGGGTATGTSVTTGADGRATVGSWTLGANAGVNTLTARIDGLAGLPTHTFTANGAEVADVAVDKSSTSTQASPGDAITYRIVVTHVDGTSHAAAVDILDELPTGLDVASATWLCAGTAGASCVPATGTGDVNTTAAIPVGASVTVTLTATVLPNAATGALVNEATADLTSSTDPTLANNTDAHSVDIVPLDTGPCGVFCDGFEGDAALVQVASGAKSRGAGPATPVWPTWGELGAAPTVLFTVLDADAKTIASLDGLVVGEARWYRVRYRDPAGIECFSAWQGTTGSSLYVDWAPDVGGTRVRAGEAGAKRGAVEFPIAPGEPLPASLRSVAASFETGR